MMINLYFLAMNCIVCQIFDKMGERWEKDGLEDLRAMLEDYFRNRKEVIKRVINCEVEHFGICRKSKSEKGIESIFL